MLSPATLRRPYLDESVSARGGARARIVERPGRWMDREHLDRLVADLQRVVRAATPAGSLDYGAASGDRARLDDAIITIVHDRAGTPIAFNALTLLDCELRGRPIEVLHLGLVMVDPAHRAGGLSSVLYGLTAFELTAVGLNAAPMSASADDPDTRAGYDALVPPGRRLANVLRVGHAPRDRVATSHRLPVGELLV